MGRGLGTEGCGKGNEREGRRMICWELGPFRPSGEVPWPHPRGPLGDLHYTVGKYEGSDPKHIASSDPTDWFSSSSAQLQRGVGVPTLSDGVGGVSWTTMHGTLRSSWWARGADSNCFTRCRRRAKLWRRTRAATSVAVIGAIVSSPEVLALDVAPSRGGLRPTDSRSACGYPHSGVISSEKTEEERLWSPRLLTGDRDPWRRFNAWGGEAMAGDAFSGGSWLQGRRAERPSGVQWIAAQVTP